MADLARQYRRSPFLITQWEGDELVLVDCDSLRRFRVDDRLLGVLSALGRWSTLGELEGAGCPLSGDELGQLVAIGVVEEGPPAGDGADGWWEPVQLAVQRQQNVLLRAAPAGARTGSPPPAFKPRPAGRVTALPPPGTLSGKLEGVLATRRTVRAYGDRQLRLAQLSTLLHHSARVTGVFADDDVGEQVLHPYASAGARSELELYVVANDVDGLASGAHHYDGRAHDLVEVRAADDHQARFNRCVLDATGRKSDRAPQAVILVTAVFGRIMWKYPGIGLPLIYRDVGCLYQTLYLVATALGLAPCAVGAGPELESSRWLGLEPRVESQVGAFLVGVR